MKVEWISTKERQPEIGRAIWRYWPGHIEEVNCYPSLSIGLNGSITHWAYADLPEKPEPPKPKELWVARFSNGEFSGYCYDSRDGCANHIASCANAGGCTPVLFREVLQ